MVKTLLIWGTLILFLFLFPVFVGTIPGASTAKTPKLVTESSYMVYAANITEEEPAELTKGKALLYFTHSEEAFKSVTLEKDGKIAVSHQSENITKFGEKLQNQLIFYGIETEILPVNNALEMSENKIPYYRAYKAIRPYVVQRIKEQDYDFIIDLHRDNAGPEVTTVDHEGEKYAKVAFVIGLDNQNFVKNKANAQLVKNEMEELVPGITRDLIMKGGVGTDGKFNQDLDPKIILIELGGIGNSEDELNRTISVIAKAAATVLEKSERVEY